MNKQNGSCANVHSIYGSRTYGIVLMKKSPLCTCVGTAAGEGFGSGCGDRSSRPLFVEARYGSRRRDDGAGHRQRPRHREGKWCSDAFLKYFCFDRSCIPFVKGNMYRRRMANREWNGCFLVSLVRAKSRVHSYSWTILHEASIGNTVWRLGNPLYIISH